MAMIRVLTPLAILVLLCCALTNAQAQLQLEDGDLSVKIGSRPPIGYNHRFLEDGVETTLTFGLNAYPYESHQVKAMLNSTFNFPASDAAEHGWTHDELTQLLQLALP